MTTEKLEKKRLSVLPPAAWSAKQPSTPAPYHASADGYGAQIQALDKQCLYDDITQALKTVYDPEIPLNVYDLGLIYGVDINDAWDVTVTMTLTAPACPMAGSIVEQVANKVAQVPGVHQAHANVVWDPPWSKDRMSEAAKLELGLMW